MLGGEFLRYTASPLSVILSSMTARPALTSKKTARPPWVRWVRLCLAAGVLATAAYLLVAGDSGVWRLSQRRAELERETARVDSLKAETDSLRLVLERLDGDLEFIEKVAREEYGMVKPGELLYRVVEKPAPEAD